jgi:chromosome segregation ATPase
VDEISMTNASRLDHALKRLTIALDQLEAAAERRLKTAAQRTDIEEEFAVLQDDRARLAVELDGAVARSQSLELANNEVARRLAKARETIEEMISHVVM